MYHRKEIIIKHFLCIENIYNDRIDTHIQIIIYFALTHSTVEVQNIEYSQYRIKNY